MASSASDPDDVPRPRIGLTTYNDRTRFGLWDTEAAVLHRSYVDMVLAAGGIPVLLPPVPHGHAELLAAVDALVLTGGADIDPVRYDQPPAPTTVIRADRDTTEFALLALARARGLPVLGVCRGMQVLAVGLGGALHQHLPEVTGTLTHQPEPGVFGSTAVRTVPGTRVAAVLGPDVVGHCHHHQAVARLGPGLRAAAHAADGTIEAVEGTGAEFLLGVQWHPEQRGDDARLFTALVAAARPEPIVRQETP